MSEYRLIIVSDPNGENEEVRFIDAEDDEGYPAEDYCSGNQTVDHDEVIEADLPSAFPLDSTLHHIR